MCSLSPQPAESNLSTTSNQIETLPDELLLHIFSYLSFNDRPQPRNLLSLMLVCQKWNLILEQIFYQNVSFIQDHNRGFDHRVETFLTALQHQRRRCEYIHTMEVLFKGGEQRPNRIKNICQCIELCRSIRKLSLRQHSGRVRWYFADSIKTLPLLEDLEMAGYRAIGLSISFVLEVLDIPTLKTLTLDGYGPFVAESVSPHSPPYRERSNPSAEEIERDLSSVIRFTSNLQTLILVQPSIGADATARILQHIKHLESFSLLSGHGSLPYYYDAPKVEELLKTHSNSLKHVCIGRVSPQLRNTPDGCQVNLQALSHLEEFYTAAANIFNPNLKLSPDRVLDSISAPKLHTFTSCFRLQMRLHPTNFTENFGEEHITWFTGFAAEFKKRYGNSGGILKRVVLDFEVKYHPDIPGILERLQDLSWPLPNVERARVEFDKVGSGLEMVVRYPVFGLFGHEIPPRR